MSEIVPPPWELNGSGIVLLYRFPASFIRRWAPDVPAQRDQLGAVMCVRYSASGVGPYHELLFIPGRVAAGGQRGWTISRIYVSTQASVASGIANWAIPKRLADFSSGPGLGHFSALLGGSPFFSIDSQSYGPPLPASSAWLPAPPAIIQASEGGWKRTTPSARGAVRLLRPWRVTADERHFPPIGQLRPLLALAICGFTMQFPVAQHIPATREKATGDARGLA
ncbi:hypothetical protein F8S13_23150 [Chloroflexia bacterium SDU3-3]|nr:hypothetical protein F8S13_23150 [Chloroflexia bacterium SDU3-3]